MLKKRKFLWIALILTLIFAGVNAIAEETKEPKQRITYRYEGGYSPYKYFQADTVLNPEKKWLATCSYQMHNRDEVKLAPFEMPSSVIDKLLKRFNELDFFNLPVESFLATDVGTTTISYQSPQRQRTVSYIATKDERLERLSWALRQAVGYSIYLKQIEDITKGKEVKYEINYPEDPFRLGLNDFLDSEFLEAEKLTSYWMRVISNKDLREKYHGWPLEDLRSLTGRDFYEEAFQSEGGYKPEVEYQMWLRWWEENKLKSRREWLIGSMRAGLPHAAILLARTGDNFAITYLEKILKDKEQSLYHEAAAQLLKELRVERELFLKGPLAPISLGLSLDKPLYRVGETLKIEVEVANKSRQRFQVPLVIKVIRYDPLTSLNAQVLQAFKEKITLEGEASHKIVKSYSLPKDLLCDENYFVEASWSEEVVVTRFTLSPLFEVVELITPNRPTGVRENTSFVCEMVILSSTSRPINNLNINLEVPRNLRILDDSKKKIEQLPAKGKQKFSWNLKALSPSEVSTLVFSIASDDGGNVQLTRQMGVRQDIRPDLAISRKDVLALPKKPFLDSQYFVSAEIHNLGLLETEGLDVHFLVDGQIIEEKVINIRAINKESVSFAWVAKEGEHNFKIVLDPHNKIEEKDEANNEYSWSRITATTQD